jgi:hypothetical protein
MDRRLGGPQSLSGHHGVQKILLSRTPAVQPVVCRYTDWASRPSTITLLAFFSSLSQAHSLCKAAYPKNTRWSEYNILQCSIASSFLCTNISPEYFISRNLYFKTSHKAKPRFTPMETSDTITGLHIWSSNFWKINGMTKIFELSKRIISEIIHYQFHYYLIYVSYHSWQVF